VIGTLGIEQSKKSIEAPLSDQPTAWWYTWHLLQIFFIFIFLNTWVSIDTIWANVALPMNLAEVFTMHQYNPRMVILWEQDPNMVEFELQKQDPRENLDCNTLLNSLVCLKGKKSDHFQRECDFLTLLYLYFVSTANFILFAISQLVQKR